MKHPSTRAVFDYWSLQRRARPAPERADIDPAAIRHALSDTFMLAADFANRLRFRLAGTRVCALFAREIKGEAFDALWCEDNGQEIAGLLEAVTAESAGVVAGIAARNDCGAQTDLEMLLLPLAHAGHGRIRALGVLAPVTPPYWLGVTPVTELNLKTLRHIRTETEGRALSPLVPDLEPVRLRHGFVVYSGGRETPSGEQTG